MAGTPFHYKFQDDSQEILLASGSLRGEHVVEYVSGNKEEHHELDYELATEQYIPLRVGSGPIFGVVEVYRDTSQKAALIRRAQLQSWLVVIAGTLLLGVVFWAYVSKALRNSNLQAQQIHRQSIDLQRFSIEGFQALSAAVEVRDPTTVGHSARVAAVAALLGRELRLTPHVLRSLKLAALMHDIGKFGVMERILETPGPLTADEYEHVRRHSVIGADLLKEIRNCDPDLALFVRHHHE